MLTITCPQCNYTENVPREKISPGTKWVKCPSCGHRFDFKRENYGPLPGTRPAVPWERRVEIGVWQGIRETLRVILFSPRKTFAEMPFRNGRREALAFGLMIGSICAMVVFFWEFLIGGSELVKSIDDFSIFFSSPLVFLVLIFFSPLLVAFNLFASSLFIHFLLLLVRGGKNGLGATLKVIAYSQAASIWTLIPVLGSPIAWFWKAVVQVIGLKEVHETGYFRVVVAFFIPVLVLLFVLAFAFYRLLLL